MADASFVGSRLDLVTRVAALPGKMCKEAIETKLPALLAECYARDVVVLDESRQVAPLKEKPGETQKKHCHDLQKRGDDKFWQLYSSDTVQASPVIQIRHARRRSTV